MLRMTAAAVRFARSVVEATGCPPILRIRVIGGGCRGLTWDAVLGDTTRRDGDRRRRNGPVEVVVDGVSARILEGSEIDVGEPGASGLRPPVPGRTARLEFLVRNVSGRQVCSCGESFTP